MSGTYSILARDMFTNNGDASILIVFLFSESIVLNIALVGCGDVHGARAS